MLREALFLRSPGLGLVNVTARLAAKKKRPLRSQQRKRKPSTKGTVSLSLGSLELESYHAAKKELSKLPAPLPLQSALEEYVAAKIALGNIPLLTAVQQFTVESQARNLEPITVSELLQEFLIAKKADGLSDRYLKDCCNTWSGYTR